MDNLKGAATPEQIAEWKEKHGTVLQYQVDDRVCYFRLVDRTVYSAAAAKVSTSPAKFNEVIVENIWLGGDETIRKDDRYFFGLIDHIEDMLGKKKGSLQTL